MTTTTGDVQVAIVDNGGATILVARQGVVAIGGLSSIGTVGQILATRDLVALAATFGTGPLPQLAASLIKVGATVLACKIGQSAAGTVRNLSAVGGAITAATNASPIAITTTTAHGLSTGDVVTVAGVVGNTAANTTAHITKTGANSYTLDGTTGSGAWVSGGTTTDTGVRWLGVATPGTVVPTITLDGTVGAYDDAYVKILFVLGGTLGTGPISYQVSYDAGRTYGPATALGTGTSIALTDIGVTIALASTKTIVTGDYLTFGTIAPAGSTTTVNAWLTAMATSSYASSGKWGHMILAGDITGSNAATYQTNIDSLLTSYGITTRAMFNARDASPPHAYGGTGEVDATWSSSVVTDFAVRAWRREQIGAGHYNVQGSVVSTIAGTPVWRRPGTWAVSCRRALVAPQVLASRVKDGSLAQIVVDPTNDPNDGFVYHDDHMAADVLNNAGFMAMRRRPGKGPSFFCRSDNLMSPVSSDFDLLPKGTVFDNFTDVLTAYFNNSIDDTARYNANGSLYSNDINTLESGALLQLAVGMQGQYLPTLTTVTIDPTYNVKGTGKVKVTGTLATFLYMREFDLTLQLQSASAS